MVPCEEQYLEEEDGEMLDVAGLIMQLYSENSSALVSVYVKSLPEQKGFVSLSYYTPPHNTFNYTPDLIANIILE